MEDETKNQQNAPDSNSAPGDSSTSDSKSFGEMVTEPLISNSAAILDNIMESVNTGLNERVELATQIDKRANDKNLRMKLMRQKLQELQEENRILAEENRRLEAREKLKKAELSSLDDLIRLETEKMNTKKARNSILQKRIEHMISALRLITQPTPREVRSQPAGSADQFDVAEDSTGVASLYILPITASGMKFDVNPSDSNQQLGVFQLCESILNFVCLESGLTIPNNHVSPAEFEKFIKKLNDAIVDIKGKPQHNDAVLEIMEELNNPKCSFKLAESILAVSRQLAIPDENVLRGDGDGSDVYGEASLEQMSIFIKQMTDKKNDAIKINDKDDKKKEKDAVFMDAGSGFGQHCCLVSAIAPVKKTIGIENNEKRHDAGEKHQKQFEKIMKYFGKKHEPIHLILGKIEDHATLIASEPTIIFINNLKFEPELMYKIKKILEKCDDGTKIITSKEIVTEKRKRDWQNEPFVRMSVKPEDLILVENNVSWSSKQFPFYVREINCKRVSYYG
ncbi:unnamed protein product [Caenorhabditis brenneri]